MYSIADNIRSTAGRYVAEAREHGQFTLTIRAGDIHRELHYTNRVPNVCQALASHLFEKEYGVELVDRTGPPSGQGTNSQFTYRLKDSHHETPNKESLFYSLRGAGEATFKALGGGEAYLERERQGFDDQ